MKKLLLAGIAGTAMVAAGTPALAHPNFHFLGACGFIAISDGTETSQTRWSGEVDAQVLATDAAGLPAPVPITVECELRINGAIPGTIVYSVTFTMYGGGVTDFSYNAHPAENVTMCEIVTIGGDRHKTCHGPTITPVAPGPVYDILNEHVWPAVEEAEQELDIIICPQMVNLEGGPADQPPFDIRSDGDVYFNGYRWRDCPPYGTSGT